MTPPAQASGRRSWGVVVLAVPLVAVLVLAGDRRGPPASGPGPGPSGCGGWCPSPAPSPPSWTSSSGSGACPPPRRSRGRPWRRARDAVDHAAAAYRDAAVPVEIPDRDRELHRRLTDGLALLAGLAALRATVDDAGGNDAATSVTVFGSYTRVIGGLLGVGTEIGLREAGQDAGLLRAVTAASAFSRARELADRERWRPPAPPTGRKGSTPPSASGWPRSAAARTRSSTSSPPWPPPEQLAWYSRAFPDTEVERSAALRREPPSRWVGPGVRADLAGWSGSATARFERMREVERSLTAEVAHQATLTDQAADRRTLAYAVAFFLAASTLVVLLVLAPGRFPPIRRPVVRPGLQPGPRLGFGSGSAAPNPQPPPGRGGAPPRWEGRLSTAPAWRVGRVRLATAPGCRRMVSQPPPSRGGTGGTGAAGPSGAATGGVGAQALPEGLAAPGLGWRTWPDKAARNWVDQQLELLLLTGSSGPGHPRLPGGSARVDRLAVRAPRNDHSLIVLGRDSRRWEGLAPRGEVAAVAVQVQPGRAPGRPRGRRRPACALSEIR